MGIEIIGLGMGLGFVLGAGYWCTDFLVIQTAMASKNMESARQGSADCGDSEDGFSVSGDFAGAAGDWAADAAHDDGGTRV